MPFKSTAQRGYLFAHHPEVAKEFASHMTHKEEMHLPEHVKKMAEGGYTCMHCGGMVDEAGYASVDHGFTTADDFDDSAEPYGEVETPQMESAGDLGLKSDEEDEEEYRPGSFAEAVRRRAYK